MKSLRFARAANCIFGITEIRISDSLLHLYQAKDACDP